MSRVKKRQVVKANSIDLRIGTLVFFFLFLFLVVEFRLFFIQILDHKKYESMAQEQYWDLQEIPPKRGNIATSDGFVLAGTQLEYLLYGEPKKITDKVQFATDLAEVVAGLRALEDFSEEGAEAAEAVDTAGPSEAAEVKDSSYYYNKYYDLIDNDLWWIGLERGLSPLEKEAIEEHGFEGIGFEDAPARYYPENTLGSHVLGFVASDNYGQKQGYYGVEGKLNEGLKGKPGKIIQEMDATGDPILAGGYTKVDPVQGRSVVLTLDRAVQYIIEKHLKDGVTRYDAVSGSVIVMDPSTGEIHGMANFPTYDPGDFGAEEGYSEESPHRKLLERVNLSISQTYEPGSVIKPLTVSSAIDKGVVTPQTTFEDNGPVWYSDYYIDNWDGKHYGTQNVIQLLQKSNNIGAAWVGHQVGAKGLYKYFSDFGIGEITGVELEGEDTGVLHDPDTWSDIALANISFGQGMSATPLQVLNGFNTIANGGYLLRPKIISKMVDEDGETDIPTRSIRRVISKKTSDTMVELLEEAASGGEARFFVLKNYRIAGKTGTAQIPVGGKYDPEKTNATFVGFMAGSKKFSMIVKLEEPNSSVYAAETAVPLWMEITQELVKYYGLPPDRIPDTI
jgi:stage V sporulation protein D (sporulation-specific penicillin-binding protein)